VFGMSALVARLLGLLSLLDRTEAPELYSKITF